MMFSASGTAYALNSSDTVGIVSTLAESYTPAARAKMNVRVLRDLVEECDEDTVYVEIIDRDGWADIGLRPEPDSNLALVSCGMNGDDSLSPDVELGVLPTAYLDMDEEAGAEASDDAESGSDTTHDDCVCLPRNRDAEVCRSESGGYECTRPDGHDGAHVACGSRHELASWIDTPDAPTEGCDCIVCEDTRDDESEPDVVHQPETGRQDWPDAPEHTFADDPVPLEGCECRSCVAARDVLGAESTETVSCPFCAYQGTHESVEGHVTGKKDDAHRGYNGENVDL